MHIRSSVHLVGLHLQVILLRLLAIVRCVMHMIGDTAQLLLLVWLLLLLLLLDLVRRLTWWLQRPLTSVYSTKMRFHCLVHMERVRIVILLMRGCHKLITVGGWKSVKESTFGNS